jgi:hypothetical protein
METVMTLRNLQLPAGVSSVVVFDQQYGKNGVVRGVEAHIAREIMAHDPRITEFVDGGPDDPEAMPGRDDRRVTAMAKVGAMTRAELFGLSKAMKLAAPATSRTETLREALLRQIAAADEDDIPVIVGTTGTDDGTPTTLSTVEQATPNRGNDSLGHKPGVHTPAGGATFSQPNHVPAPANEPAPSGLGPLTPAGTVQPPYNQLETNTGQPTGNQEVAPFPITVAPINPQTGKPFEAGDPRIPANALPPVRQDPEVNPAAVDALHEAAGRIDAAVDLANGGTPAPLLTAEQEAERQKEASTQPNVSVGTDPNHGNDGEGTKPADAPLKN